MTTEAVQRTAWQRFMAQALSLYDTPVPLAQCGTLTRVTGLTLEATGLQVPVGAQCLIEQAGSAPVLAEVVGFNGPRSFLMPAGAVHGLVCGAQVVPLAPLHTSS